ncbi:MAG: ABC transporter permease [Paludibacteraceae bacterium]|nr:ABC transporter permease [Paludibacteraceae bacterium]
MDFLSEIWQTITKNRSRSLLTAFGVFWGMLMLIVLIGLGNALTGGIYSQVDGFAMNSCTMGASVTGKPYKGFQRGRQWSIYLSDLDVISQHVEGIEALSPMVFAGEKTISIGESHGDFNLVGITAEYPKVMVSPLLYGRFINEIDMRDKRKVCVIGIDVYRKLFPKGGNPIGQRIFCGSIPFNIVGVRKQNENNVYIGGNPDEMVQAPVTTIQKAYNLGESVHILMAVAKDGIPVSQIEKAIKDELKLLHNIAPDDDKALWGFNAEEEMKALTYLGIGLSALIWLIGLGTLISGAVGVSNIMLVTVRERTKEIGIRRAIGASPWVIMRQIIAESVVLTSLAGLAGIMAGVGAVLLTARVLEHADTFIKAPNISFGVAITCLVIIIVIGILAGLLPALRALKIKPVEALSEE